MYGNGVGGIHYIHVEFSKADVAEFKALSPSDGFISGLAYIAMYLGSNDEMDGTCHIEKTTTAVASPT